jgi:Flp pilus assembly protein TadG
VTSRQRSRHHGRGQALVELALILPIMALVFVGAATTATFLGDDQVAGQAVRAGIRLASEDGNGGYSAQNPPALAPCQEATNNPPGTGSATDPCTVDNEVVRSVLTVANTLTNVNGFDAIEIDIYEPCAWSGQSCTSNTDLCTYTSGSLSGSLQTGDPVDRYKYSSSAGTWTRQENAGDTLYTLNLRNQTGPLETPIGVRLQYTFAAAAPFNFLNFTTSQYATMCLPPNTGALS